MISVNMDSILSKIKKSQKAKAAIEKKEYDKASQAVSKLSNVVTAEIDSSVGGKIAYSVNPSSPIKIGDDKFMASVDIGGNLHRPSLEPNLYGGIDNIIALFNNGYAARAQVSGFWHGNYIPSLTHRSGERFIQSAVQNFIGNYGSEYGVVDININSIYE